MRRTVGLVVGVGTLVLLAPGCKKDSPEAQIRGVIDEMASAAEAGDVSGVLAHIDNDFSTGRGRDKKAIRQLLLREVLQGKRIGIQRRGLDIEVGDGGGQAQARFKALFTRTRKGAAPERAGAWDFDVEFGHSDGDWKVTGAEYQRIPAKDFLAP